MTSEQWKRVWDLYEAAYALPAPDADRLLQSSTEDPEVIREAAIALAATKAESSVATAEVDPPEWRRLGKTVSRYEVLEPLGRGGVGEVYVGRDCVLGRMVALKFVADDQAGKSAVRRFIREAQAASALNHPNIVTIYEVVSAGDELAIAMELVEGTPLRELCVTPLPQKTVLHYAWQIAQALAAAHASGIVHRDVKPENIMVRQDGYVKVLDFGLARVKGLSAEGLTSTAGLPVGTLRYMSPEQCRGETAKAPSDMFALGVTLFEMCTGQHPFQADSPLAIAHSIVSSHPKPPSALNPEVPQALNSLILDMLIKDPDTRCTSAEAARRLSEISQPGPAGKSSKGIYAALAGVAAMAGLAAWLMIGARREEMLQIRPVPLTAQTGWETYPAISPDGNTVAFAWSDSFDAPKEIYVKRIGDAGPVKLASIASGKMGNPAWSADGERIYYKQALSAGPGAVWSISKDGRGNRQVFELADGNTTSSLSCSPDGKWLAYTDHPPHQISMAVYLYGLESGERHKLTTPPKDFWGDWDPKFSPDGKTIAFKRVEGYWKDFIYSVPVSGGTPRQLTSDRQGIWGHDWMPDGKSLLLSCQRGGTAFGLWRFPVDASAKPQLIGEGGFDSIMPASAPRARKIAWVNQILDINIYRVPAAGGTPPIPLVASTRRDSSIAASPDGRIAFSSDRSGSTEFYLARADGSEQTKVTNFRRGPLGDPVWSQDGRRIISAAYGDQGMFVLDCPPPSLQCSEPHFLNNQTVRVLKPSWASRGGFIYYADARGQERVNVWRRLETGGPETQLTRDGGQQQVESRDGKWLYYVKLRSGIWRMPVPDSASINPSPIEEQLVKFPRATSDPVWTLGTDEIFFYREAFESAPAGIYAYHLKTRKIRMVVAGVARNTLALSPDQRQLLFCRLDRSGSNVLVADIAAPRNVSE